MRCGCCCGRAGRTTARPGRRPCGRCWRPGTGTVSRRPGARAASDVEEKGRGIKGGKSFRQAFSVLKILPEIRKRNPVTASWPGGQTSVVRAASGCGRSSLRLCTGAEFRSVRDARKERWFLSWPNVVFAFSFGSYLVKYILIACCILQLYLLSLDNLTWV